MHINKIQVRDYSEAGKNAILCEKKREKILQNQILAAEAALDKRILEKEVNFPLLTYENVYNWYWNHTPLLSTSDIAEKIGINRKNVENFMKKNNIPRRSYSESVKNWHSNPRKRKNYEEGIKSRKYPLILGNVQKLILCELSKNKSLFISELLKIPLLMKRNPKVIRASVSRLFELKLISREKQFNYNSQAVRKNQYKYSLNC